jgi:hypothetical protein
LAVSQGALATVLGQEMAGWGLYIGKGRVATWMGFLCGH